MKKILFNKWYEKYGRSFASMTFPYNETDEKEIRKRAKTIYSTVYNDVADSFRENLLIVQDEVYNKIIDIKECIEENKDFIKFIKSKKNAYISALTNMYNSYKKGEMNKEVFESNKKIMCNEVDTLKETININTVKGIMLKDALKKYEFLLNNSKDDCGL